MRIIFSFALFFCIPFIHAAEPFKFPEAKHGKGELRYINGIPVLMLKGSPEEIGEQMGILGLKPASGATQIFKDLLKREKLDLIIPLLRRFGELMLTRYPDAYKKEFESMVKHSGMDRELLVIGNSYSELRHLAGCSAMMVDHNRSESGHPIFGRNWDFPPIKGMHQLQMLIIYKPDGKKAFAVFGFPGSVAASAQSTGINSDGLAIGGNLITESADKAPQVDWFKSPSECVSRRILEECSTIADVETLVRKDRPAERHALVLCDQKQGVVLEITPKTVVCRHDDSGITFGTNHFESKGLSMGDKGIFNCPRMAIFRKKTWNDKVKAEQVKEAMNDVCQRNWTAHSLIFEPATMKLKLSFGDGEKSATEMPYREIDLKSLFAEISK